MKIRGIPLDIILVAGMVVSIAIVGFLLGRDTMKIEAAEVGAAEYYLDDDHRRQWRWKLPLEVRP